MRSSQLHQLGRQVKQNSLRKKELSSKLTEIEWWMQHARVSENRIKKRKKWVGAPVLKDLQKKRLLKRRPQSSRHSQDFLQTTGNWKDGAGTCDASLFPGQRRAGSQYPGPFCREISRTSFPFLSLLHLSVTHFMHLVLDEEFCWITCVIPIAKAKSSLYRKESCSGFLVGGFTFRRDSID